MIFVTRNRDEKPLFSGFVNAVTETDMPNGGKLKKFMIGTSERRKDDTREYSSWPVVMIGNARTVCDELEKDTMIDVYSVKLTNTAKKNDDGTWGKNYLNVYINDYVIHEANGESAPPPAPARRASSGKKKTTDDIPEDENPF